MSHEPFKPFAERMREDRRRLLLQLLSEQTTKRSNSTNLYSAIYALGIPGKREDVIDDLRHLDQWGLVKLDEAAAGVLLVYLTQRGTYVLTGRDTVPGVTGVEHH